MDGLTIGQLAERTGFSASSLRYYEGIGLVAPAGRTDAGYRLYDASAVDRLAFVARAKQLGCTLPEITDLLAVWDESSCSPLQRRFHQLVTQKITATQEQLAELSAFSAQLRAAAERLGAEPADGPCAPGCACLPQEDATGSSAVPAPSVPVALTTGPADAPIACSLSAGAVEERRAEWAALLAHVTERSATPDGGLRLALGPDTPVADLARLVTAEQGCCAFFSFAVTVDGRGLALEVRAPAGAAAEAVVDALFGTAA